MGEWNKVREDEYNQGHHNTGKTNAPNDPKAVWQSVLPRGWDKLAPVNQPNHTFPGEWKEPNHVQQKTNTSISLAYLTIDSEEHATRFIKDLFKNGLVAAVQMIDGGFERSYLKFGRASTEKTRVRLEMVVPDDKVKLLIDYVNNNNPTTYDYPVPDLTVIPITGGNTKFINWAKNPTKIDYKKIYPSD